MKPILLLTSLILASCASYKGTDSYQTKKDIFYAGTTEIRQQGDLYLPLKNSPTPIVILVHGGGWSSRDRKDMDKVAESLASNGLAVLNINYRLAPKYQHPAPIDDLESAILYVKKNSAAFNIDPHRIGLWGYSSGGHTVSYYALTRAKNSELKVSAVVTGGAPYDFSWYPHSPYIKGYMGKYRDQMSMEYRNASPSELVTSEAPPFYLYHAEEDRLVEYAQSRAFEAKLKASGVPVKVHTISFWGHAGAFVFSDRAIEKGVKFLNKHL